MENEQEQLIKHCDSILRILGKCQWQHVGAGKNKEALELEWTRCGERM